jgi:microcystin-dependent protein
MDPYLGEIRLFPYNRIPSADGWKICNGQSLTMQQNMALYTLIGSQFGGDDKTYFNLPNLNGRVLLGYGRSPISGNAYLVGKSGGQPAVALDSKTIPSHNHNMMVRDSYDAAIPGTNILGNETIPTVATQTKKNTGNVLSYVSSTPDASKKTILNPKSISTEGGGLAHENRMPFVTMVYCIATVGYYPPRP